MGGQLPNQSINDLQWILVWTTFSRCNLSYCHVTASYLPAGDGVQINLQLLTIITLILWTLNACLHGYVVCCNCIETAADASKTGSTLSIQ